MDSDGPSHVRLLVHLLSKDALMAWTICDVRTSDVSSLVATGIHVAQAYSVLTSYRHDLSPNLVVMSQVH